MVNDTDRGHVASMTGYAAREGVADGAGWSWELRSVNGRGLDLRLRLPDGLGALEAPLRKKLSERVKRGSITLSLRLAKQGAGAEGLLSEDGIALAIERLKQIRGAADAHFITLHPPSAAEIISLMPPADTMAGSQGPDIAALLADTDPLIDAFCEMRLKEGAALERVLADQLLRLNGLIDAAEKAAGARSESHADRLRASLATVLEATDAVDESRIAQELAVITTKSDVTEEIDRLRAHVDAAVALLEQGGPVGRKLDFLMQEFNREANTLCSKSGDATLTAVGLDLKLTIDQMREQVQNLE